MSNIDTVSHFIGGNCIDAQGGRDADVFNPASGAPVARGALCTAGEVDVAVGGAAAVFPASTNTPPFTSARVLFKFLQPMRQHADEFSAMLTREYGKTFADAQG